LALSAGAVAISSMAHGVGAEYGEYGQLINPPLSLRLLNFGIAIVTYLRKTVWPTDLAYIYTRPHEHFPVAVGISCGALVVGATIMVLGQRRRRPYWLVGWLWFVGTLLPVSGLLPVGYHTMADRYTYVPHIGLFIAVAWSLADGLANRVPRAL